MFAVVAGTDTVKHSFLFNAMQSLDWDVKSGFSHWSTSEDHRSFLSFAGIPPEPIAVTATPLRWNAFLLLTTPLFCFL
jgi:hypothetical protein